MAVFASGNPIWDQGGNAFAGGIMSALDPSKTAQAGYYGAETAKVLTDTDRLRFENDKRRNLPTNPLDGMGRPNYVEPVSPLAGTVAGAQMAPPAAPPPQPQAQPSLGQVVSGQQPSLGTDGKPLPPDPSLSQGPLHPGSIQQPGGGVKNAPPAQGNGSPAPPLDLTVYATTLAQTGYPVEVQRQMLGAVLNSAVSRGLIDKVTANTMLGRFGAPAMYGDDQSTYRQGTVNATNITTTGMNNRTTLENTRLTGQNARDLKGMDVEATTDANGNKTLTPNARITAPNAPVYQGYDPARALGGDKLIETSSVPGDPTASPVLTPTRDANNKTPYQPTLAAQGVKTVNVVDNATGKGLAIQEADLAKAPPGKYRRMTPEDEKIIPIYDANGRIINQTAASTVATGGTPVPTSTDQFNAQGMGGVFQRYLAGNAPGAQEAGEALTAAQTAGVPKQQISPDQQTRIGQESTAHLQAMYPVPSGTHFQTASGPIAPHPDTAAYHAALVRELQNGAFRNNPAAAVTRAWDVMRERGMIPRTANEAREVGITWPGAEEPRVTSDGKVLIMLRKDKAGNILDGQGQVVPWPGGGPRSSPLANTVATGGTLPQGAIAAAPPLPDGSPAPDGKTGTLNGRKTITRGGHLYYADGGP